MQRVILNSLAVGNSVSACNLISSVSAPRSKLIPFLITSSWPESVRSGKSRQFHSAYSSPSLMHVARAEPIGLLAKSTSILPTK